MSVIGRVVAGCSAAALLLALSLAVTAPAQAQAPSSDIERRALEIEKQLLCPQCTNKRLDTCEITICLNMRAEIRRQLESGADTEEVLAFFEDRYGQRVLAELPKDGFNLWLWAWVIASTGAIAVVGGRWMVRQRRRQSERVAAAGTDEGRSESPDSAGEHAQPNPEVARPWRG